MCPKREQCAQGGNFWLCVWSCWAPSSPFCGDCASLKWAAASLWCIGQPHIPVIRCIFSTAYSIKKRYNCAAVEQNLLPISGASIAVMNCNDLGQLLVPAVPATAQHGSVTRQLPENMIHQLYGPKICLFFCPRLPRPDIRTPLRW